MLKKRIFIIISALIIILAVISFFLLRGTSSPKDLSQIEEDGVLHIVTDYNPAGYYVSGDTIAGFNHDLIQLLKSRIPFEIEILLESSLDKSIDGLKKGKYDVMARNIPVTSELRTSLRFTEPVAQNRQVLIQRKKEYNDGAEPLRSHLNLAKKTLYVPQNSPAILRIRNLSHEIGDTIFVKEDPIYGQEQLAMMVAAKEIDYAVCDEIVAARVARSIPEIDYSTLIGFTHLEAWAVSEKSPVLLDSLNVWIKEVKKTREYARIYKKYYK
ncbi:membrane-bound lytic murein transglycosylase F [Dysgonomonas sp. PFB1-18]|uniref:transporter substrate-binding domain-containing protein n=1 Tax=unclassified Dysgonomonas TaxID=2630389 RepID=UPI0024730383|nr:MULTISPECIES: transporter substrate-binding domain-containing protein [unclassified Dysgonomonas]MDH6307858.1 membrane-bound lytic murein transglycosylase F [Dysgonomonas sp. PF1-14]MDH6337776.1 membrane-bound lytic murein transglycosylase F [Dysgonomonas sp. PF1-16]MDH6379000.1 membrane-bound lytic murein transglycosylase F [Dysgonomonas sp. PFB1-18]MDH6396635.1 membrane-bound lytic murein transglycosylase F [Dysgonomonas sp. PF1-23]